jgi:hypothetical protein
MNKNNNVRGKHAVLAISVSLLIAGCASNDRQVEPLGCEGHANYKVVFSSTWSNATHPQDAPNTPHMSHLFGVSHNQDISFWKLGESVKDGIKNIAEKGSGFKFIKEAEWAIRIDQAKDIFDGNDIKSSPGSSEAEFKVTEDFPLVTLTNMLAPSPDWITGVSSLSLCENGRWIDFKTIPAEVYDAGTDGGRTYTAKDQPLAERQPVALLNESGRTDYASFPAIGEYVFTKIESITNPDGAGYVKHLRDALKKERLDRED